MNAIQLKRGTTFGQILDIPAQFADGYFASGWTMTSEARNAASGALLADLSPQWVDPVTTRSLQLIEHDTAEWPDAVLIDVVFKRADGYVLSTGTIVVHMSRRVSVPG